MRSQVMPRTEQNGSNEKLLQAALEGLELQRQKIEENIGQVRSLLGTAETRRGKTAGNASSYRLRGERQETAERGRQETHFRGSETPLGGVSQKSVGGRRS